MKSRPTRKARVTFETVRRIALALPGVEDGLSYNAPALKMNGKLFIRLREDLDSIVLRMSFTRRDELIASDPRTYYVTDHYLRYEWILVRLGTVSAKALEELIVSAYAEATPSKKQRTRRPS